MTQKECILTCTGVKFYSRKDEDAFFEWLEKLPCITSMPAAGRDLYLHITKPKNLTREDLRELIAIFHRYKIDMKPLGQFLSSANKEWFLDNTRAFWHKKIFTEDNPYLKRKRIIHKKIKK